MPACSSARPSLRAQFLLASVLLVLPTPGLYAQFTGTWSGSVTEMTYCPQTAAKNKPTTISLLQSGNAVSGVITTDLSDVCNPAAATVSGSLPITGTASGNSFSGIVIGPGGPEGVSTTTASMTISGTSLTFLATDAQTTVSGTFTQSSSQPPASTLTGSYSGTFTEVYPPKPPCTNTLSYTGPMSATLVQTGSAASGLFFASPKGTQNCQIVSQPDMTLIFSGEMTGNNLKGVLVASDVDVPISGTLSGSTLSGSGSGTDSTFTFTMTRGATGGAPSVASFTADPSAIGTGGASSLRWATGNATSVSIDQGVGAQPVIGSVTVRPSQTTTYKLTATGSGGTATATTTVTVSSTTAIPKVVISEYPQGMLQSSGGTLPTDSYTLTNIGAASTTVTLDQTGSFFTQSPTLFNLPAGKSQVIAIRATQQVAGKYEATATISATGAAAGLSVPVRLIVSDPPALPVNVTTPAARSEVMAPAAQTPSGSVSFTNGSTTAIQGMIVPDTPWVVPASTFLTLAAGETRAVQFSIDRSLRPDGVAPIGAATGSLTFRYVNSASGKAATLGTTIISNVSVTIVDLVTLSASASTPPALGAAETALFVSGIASRSGWLGDLTLSNRSPSPVTDVKIYFAPAGASSGAQAVSLPSIASNTSVMFPGIVKNIFGLASQVGTIQIRSSMLLSNSVAVSGAQITSAAGQSSITALPVMRSDRGAAAGDTIYLPGARKSSTQSTTLHLQEVAGYAATASVEFLDANGNVLSTRASESIAAFGSLELADVAPVSTATIRVKNTSSAAAKIDAWALLNDTAANDSFEIAQIGPPTDPMYVPAFDAVSGTRNLILNLANSSSSSINVTVTSYSSGMRRRAVKRSIGEVLAGSPVSVTIPPYGTKEVVVADVGVIKLSGSSALRAAAMYSVAKGGGSFGSGAAALPTGRALASTNARRFAAIDDASPDSVAAARPLTFRNNLMLAEISGQPATVRLSLRYTFPVGSLARGLAGSSREFALPGGSIVLVADLARAIIGDDRLSFGDLHGVVLDVSVISSTGSVLPFLQVIDNGTGEVTIRHE